MGRCVFDAFTTMLLVIKENEAICQTGISLGQLAKVASETAMKFFMLSFNKIDESCDNGIIRPLKTFEEDLKVKPAAASPKR